MERVHPDDRTGRTGRRFWHQLGVAALLALVLALAFTTITQADSDVLDQHNPHPEIVYSSGPLLGAPTSTGDYGNYPQLGQSFTAGILDRVKLRLGRVPGDSDTASVNVQIYGTDSLYYPTASPLASALIPVS